MNRWRFFLEMVAAYCAALSFAALFRIPRNRLAVAGLAGMLSWTVNALMLRIGAGKAAAGFCAAAIAAGCAEWGARRLRTPVTLLILPAIIPLVPGLGAYSAMLSFLRGASAEGLTRSVEAALVALSISAGVVAAATLFRPRKRT